MPVTPPPEKRFPRPPNVVLLRYGSAILSVAAAVLLMNILGPFSVADTRPALLVAVTISALYGGAGPGMLAVLLAGLVSRDPAVLVAGVALTAICEMFRRTQARRGIPQGAVRHEPTPDLTPTRFANPAGGSIAFSSETLHTPPPFLE